MRLQVDQYRCIKCLFCVNVCVADAIRVAMAGVDTLYETKRVWIQQDKCNECLECYNICPSGAIYDELSSISGNPQDSIAHTSSPHDVLATPNLPTTVPPQLPNGCLPAMMDYAGDNFCSGNYNEGDFNMYYKQKYNEWIYQNGVPLERIEDLVKNFFITESFTNFYSAVDSGWITMTDIASDIPNSSHNVAVVGYNDSTRALIYMDSEKTKLMEAHYSKFNQYYAIPISGCK